MDFQDPRRNNTESGNKIYRMTQLHPVEASAPVALSELFPPLADDAAPVFFFDGLLELNSVISGRRATLTGVA